jgi:hypothetical protein
MANSQKNSFKPVFKIGLLVFILGGIFGTMGDALHVWAGVLRYETTQATFPVTGQPWWVFPQFGAACVLIGFGQLGMDRVLAKLYRPTPRRLREMKLFYTAIGLLALLVLWGSSGFLTLHTGGGRDVVLALGAMTVWFFLDRTPESILMMVLTAIGGVAGEYFNSKAGNFYYAPEYHNLFGTLPSWLAWLYFPAAVVLGNFMRFLTR